MPLVRPGIRRLFDLMLRRRDLSSRDVGAEVRLHLELRVEQLKRKGLTDEEARREAERRFGSIERAVPALEALAQRRDRRMTFRDWLESVGQDVRYALRGLGREPAFATFAVLTLALGIGANAAMYGVVDRLLLRGPDHVRDPQELVRITGTNARAFAGRKITTTFGYVMYGNLRSASSFDGLAAWTGSTASLGRSRDARTVNLAAATADFFPLLGVRAVRGRFFTPDEDNTAAPAQVVVLSEPLWRTQFGADDSILGRTVTIDQQQFTVVGIAPRGFTGVELRRVDLWIPMSEFSKDITNNWSRAWNAQWLQIVARLRAGVTPAQAAEEATRIHRSRYNGRPNPQVAQATIGTIPIRFTDQGKESTEASVSRWLIGVTLVVLLIACSNVANLLLARAIRRRGETGIRMALGAGRKRLARLFVTESLIISALGGVASLVVATVIATLVRTSLLNHIEWTSSPVSGRVLLVATAMTLVVGLIVGVAPAIHAARTSLQQAIQRGKVQGRRLGIGSWPTVLQATLTACLLIGAGLFIRSLQRAQGVPFGFDSQRVLVAQVAFAELGDVSATERATARARRNETMRRALGTLQQHPQVEGAAIAVGSPFGNAFGVDLYVPGYDSIPKMPGGGPYISAVTPGYFRAVGTKLRRGRYFQDMEGPGTEPVVIVNETMARTLWPRQDALSKCMHIGADTAPCARVVGIVEDAKTYELREPPSMQYYIPFGQEKGIGGSVFMIRPRGTPESFQAAAVKLLESTDANIDRATAWPIQSRIDPLLRPWKLGATIFMMGGVLALMVAALGLYSVMSYSVAQRTHEMGVRIALGARARSIVGMVVRQGMILAGMGITAGVVIAIVAGQQIQDLLFDTSPKDMAVIGTSAAVLLASAMLASLWPALRAGRVDPMRALKSE